jgi:hypothetical protein
MLNYLHFTTLMCRDIFLDAAWNAVEPGAKKCYSGKASASAFGRILEE